MLHAWRRNSMTILQVWFLYRYQVRWTVTKSGVESTGESAWILVAREASSKGLYWSGSNNWIVQLVPLVNCSLFKNYLGAVVVHDRIVVGFRRDALNTTFCDKVCQWLATGRLFSPGTPVSSTNKIDRHENWNIVDSGAKHHNPNPTLFIFINEMAETWLANQSVG